MQKIGDTDFVDILTLTDSSIISFMGIVLAVIANAVLLWAVAYFLPYDPATGAGVITSNTLSLYLVGGAILGILNFIVKPILHIIGFPFILLSFGLFIFVINGIVLYLLETILRAANLPGVIFNIEGFSTYAFAVAICSVFNILYRLLFK